ncbi:hypothetical protein FQZ97_598940 [compost metagenome]
MAFDLGDEQVAAVQPCQAVEHLRQGVRLAEQGGAQRGAEAVADGGVQQQGEIVRRQVGQHLLLEIVGEGTGIAHLHVRIAAALPGLQVDGEQLQAGGPAVGQFVQDFGVALVDLPQVFAEEACRFLGAETQVAQIELAQQALCAQAGQRMRHGHRGARTEHQMEMRRRVFEQPLQDLEDARVAQEVQVVEHQHQFLPVPGDALHQGDDPVFHGQVVVLPADEDGGLAHHRRVHLGEARQQAAGEARQVVVLAGQGEPGDIEVQRQQLAAPGQQRAGLAAAGRTLDHHAALPPRFEQAGDQRIARHQVACPAGRQDFGAGDDLQFAVGGRISGARHGESL